MEAARDPQQLLGSVMRLVRCDAAEQKYAGLLVVAKLFTRHAETPVAPEADGSGGGAEEKQRQGEVRLSDEEAAMLLEAVGAAFLSRLLCSGDVQKGALAVGVLHGLFTARCVRAVLPLVGALLGVAGGGDNVVHSYAVRCEALDVVRMVLDTAVQQCQEGLRVAAEGEDAMVEQSEAEAVWNAIDASNALGVCCSVLREAADNVQEPELRPIAMSAFLCLSHWLALQGDVAGTREEQMDAAQLQAMLDVLPAAAALFKNDQSRLKFCILSWLSEVLTLLGEHGVGLAQLPRAERVLFDLRSGLRDILRRKERSKWRWMAINCCADLLALFGSSWLVTERVGEEEDGAFLLLVLGLVGVEMAMMEDEECEGASGARMGVSQKRVALNACFSFVQCVVNALTSEEEEAAGAGLVGMDFVFLLKLRDKLKEVMAVAVEYLKKWLGGAGEASEDEMRAWKFTSCCRLLACWLTADPEALAQADVVQLMPCMLHRATPTDRFPSPLSWFLPFLDVTLARHGVESEKEIQEVVLEFILRGGLERLASLLERNCVPDMKKLLGSHKAMTSVWEGCSVLVLEVSQCLASLLLSCASLLQRKKGNVDVDPLQLDLQPLKKGYVARHSEEHMLQLIALLTEHAAERERTEDVELALLRRMCLAAVAGFRVLGFAEEVHSTRWRALVRENLLLELRKLAESGEFDTEGGLVVVAAFQSVAKLREVVGAEEARQWKAEWREWLPQLQRAESVAHRSHMSNVTRKFNQYVRKLLEWAANT